jgi:hypothetical protein
MDVVPLDGAGSSAEAAIDVCGSCRGAFFEFFDGEPSAISRAISRRPPGRVPARTPNVGVMCPDCAAPMVRKPYLGRGPEIARCEQCMAAFVTADEMQALAQLSLEADPKDAAPAPSWTARVWQWLGHGRENAAAAAPTAVAPPSNRETPADLWREVDHLVERMREEGDASSRPTRTSEDLQIVVRTHHYDLVYEERGEQNVIRSERSRDAFLFGLVREQARALAKASEPIRNDRDHRRIIFPGAVARLRKIDAGWAEREAAEQAEELASDPYDDAKWKREAAFNKLRKQGRSEQDAHRGAAKQFPRPLKGA